MTTRRARGFRVRTVLLYPALLVGGVLPVVFLLFLGRGLTAPRSVGGTWAVEREGTSECGDVKLSGPLAISQSGVYVQLTWGEGRGTTLDGRIAGDEIAASKPGDARVEGRFEGSKEALRLRASVVAEGCPSPIAFVATRTAGPTSQRPDGH